MDDRSEDPFDEVVLLARAAWNSARLARLARRFAGIASRLVVEAAALPVEGISREVQAIRRAAGAAERHALRTEEAARRTGDTLASTLVAPDPAAFRRSGRGTFDAAEKTRRAVVRTHRHAAPAGRVAAGLAARHEPPTGAEPLWTESRELLRLLPLGVDGDDEIVIGDALGRGRAMVTGLLAHSAWQAPAYAIFTVDDGRNRYVQVRVDEDGVLLESPADVFLGDDDPLSASEVQALLDLGFGAPDAAHANWWTVLDSGVAARADVVLEALARVHGLGPDDAVAATIAHASHHATSEPEHDPAALEVEDGSLPEVASALAERLRGWIDQFGVDSLWATVHQPASPFFAHLGSNLDGGLYTEVVGDESLDPADRLSDVQRARLRALGWTNPSGPVDEGLSNHSRIWPAPFDLDAACWHVVLTLLSVYGLDLDEPIHVTVEPFVTSSGIS